MQRDKFEKILDQLTESWYRNTEFPQPGLRIDKDSEIEGAFPVVLKHKIHYTTCSWCGNPEKDGKTYLYVEKPRKKGYNWRGRCLDCKKVCFFKGLDFQNNK